jgi:hypothetical protein
MVSAKESKPPTLAEIADSLGIPRWRANQFQAQGMPIDSIESARVWCESEAMKFYE